MSMTDKLGSPSLTAGTTTRGADRYLVGATLLLLGISVLFVFSTTAIPSQQFYGDTAAMVTKHVVHILLGLCVFGVAMRVNIAVLRALAVPMILFAFLLLCLVLIPGVGSSAGGAQRWLQLGPLRLQPAEICKVLLMVYFAAYIDRYREQMSGFVAGVLAPFAILSVFAVLLLLEPDFGSTAVLTLVVFGQLFTAARISHFCVVGIVAAISAAALIVTSPYRMRRLVAFMDPFQDPSASGYQLIQSLIAVGSGGPLGSGLGAGRQKLFYLPASHTDFIFAVIAEELGSIGAISVLAIFLFILFRGLLIASRLRGSGFCCSLAVGCTLMMVLPALLNMGVVLGLLPTKGLVLPLIAYGGTAMIVHLGVMGLLVRLSSVELES
jgi:cell division protein FtsW